MKNAIIIILLLLIIGGIVFYIVREKKKGVKCIGCPHSKTCKKCTCSSKKQNH